MVRPGCRKPSSPQATVLAIRLPSLTQELRGQPLSAGQQKQIGAVAPRSASLACASAPKPHRFLRTLAHPVFAKGQGCICNPCQAFEESEMTLQQGDIGINYTACLAAYYSDALPALEMARSSSARWCSRPTAPSSFSKIWYGSDKTVGLAFITFLSRTVSRL